MRKSSKLVSNAHADYVEGFFDFPPKTTKTTETALPGSFSGRNTVGHKTTVKKTGQAVEFDGRGGRGVPLAALGHRRSYSTKTTIRRGI